MNVQAERELTFIDKSGWGGGPWQAEPDKVQWTDAATGMPCLVVRGPSYGSLCGYVGVAEGHPLFGVEYDRVEDDLDVHGGLTYSDFCQEAEGAEDHGICHVPQPGQPDRVWWFGFDTAHAGDLAPAMEALRRRLPSLKLAPRGNLPEEVYRDLTYVQAECARLAEQLARVARASGRR